MAHLDALYKRLARKLGRRLGVHIRHRRRAADESKKRSYIDKFIPHIGVALKEILALSEKQEGLVVSTLRNTLERSREHNA